MGNNETKDINDLVSHFEKKRKHKLFMFVFFIVSASLFGVAGFTLILVAAIAFSGTAQVIMIVSGFLSFLAITPSFIVFAMQQSSSYKAELQKTSFDLLKAKLPYTNLSFSMKSDSYLIQKSISAPISQKFDFDETEFFKGNINGVPFFSLIYSYVVREGNHPRNCYGRYLQCDCSITDSEVLVKNLKGKDFFQEVRLPYQGTTESLSFNDQFKVFGEGQNKLNAFLDSVRIDGMRFLNEEHSFNSSFYVNPFCACVFMDDFNVFAPRLSRKVTEEYLLGFKNELKLPLEVSKILEINQANS